MTGTVSGDQRGIIPRSVEKVLEQSLSMSTGGWTYQLEASFLEVRKEGHTERETQRRNQSSQTFVARILANQLSLSFF